MLLPAITTALAGLLVGGAVWGTAPLCIALVLVTGTFLGSWHDCLGVPGARGGAAVAALAASVSLALLLVVPTMADPPLPLTPVAPVLGVSLALAFIHQLMRDHPRDQVVASLTATTAATVLAALGTLAVPARSGPGGTRLLAAALAGAIAAALVLGSRRPAIARGVRAVHPVGPVHPVDSVHPVDPVGTVPAVSAVTSGLALLAGAVLGLSVEAAQALGSAPAVVPATAAAAGALAGLGTAMVAVVAAVVAGPKPPTPPRLMAAGATPVLCAGPLAYVIGVVGRGGAWG